MTAPIRPADLTEEMIREVRDRVMGGSPLSEDTLVALGDLVLDDGDPDVNIADARDRICAWLNEHNARRNVSGRPGRLVRLTKCSTFKLAIVLGPSRVAGKLRVMTYWSDGGADERPNDCSNCWAIWFDAMQSVATVLFGVLFGVLGGAP